MINLIIFIIGLVFLIYFSYKDLRFRQINNTPILIFFLAGLVISIISIKSIEFYLMWVFLSIVFFILWEFNGFGGADFKILISLIPFVLISSPNLYAYSFIFICIFLVIGLVYGIILNLIIKKIKEKPFIHIINFIYVLFWLFRFIN